MKITFLSGVRTTPDRGRVVDIEASAFLDWLGDRDRAPSIECADNDAKLAGDGFVFGQYKPGATSKSYQDLAVDSSTDLLCYDVDDIDAEAMARVTPKWEQVDAVTYSTWKHTHEAPRMRVVVRLSRPVSNATDGEFRKVYGAVAFLLGIPADPRASDRCRFYFGPQHKPGANGTVERMRYTGEPLDVDGLLAMVRSGAIPVAAVREPADVFTGVRTKPPRKVVTTLAKRLSASGGKHGPRVGAALWAMLRGEEFAPGGERHDALILVAFEIAKAVHQVDAEWFFGEYIANSVGVMWPDGGDDSVLDHWLAGVSSAENKLEAGEMAAEAQVAAAARYVPAEPVPMDDDTLARAAAVSGGLVCEHRGNYYVFDPRSGEYMGPLRGTGLPAACRGSLVGVPGFAHKLTTKNGGESLKSGPALVEQYGAVLRGIEYHAMPIMRSVFDVEKGLIRVPAYIWNKWDARMHQIADELLRAVCGDQYERVAAWFSQLRNLNQPLPALTFVGDRGTWKSRICEIISRFWGARDAPTACAASQVMNRFSAPLLDNPVIHSDEQLARSETGRALPEAYRRSITEPVHAVERKGVDPVMLHTHTRHVISVNEVGMVFGGEIDAASVEATIERFLIVMVDAEAVARFEKRWEGTRELTELREGTLLLEHIMWIETTSTYVSTCRLYVDTGTDSVVLLQARFSDEVLSMCLMIAIEALLAEPTTSVPGQLERLPLVCDDQGVLRLAPARIAALWTDSRLVAGSGLRKPSTQRIGQILTKAGLKLQRNERAGNNRKWKGWAVNHVRLNEFLIVEGSHDWDDIRNATRRLFSIEPDRTIFK